jgi:hypothetical protein
MGEDNFGFNTDFEKRLVQHVLLSECPGKHAVKSAIRALERAWELKDRMPDLAIFLGITSEEESATAVFSALKSRKYPGCERLKPHNHVQKTALHPFLLAVGQVMKELVEYQKPVFLFDSKNSLDGREMLRIRVTLTGPSGQELYAMPLPPLNFEISLNGARHDFTAELQAVASGKKARDIKAYVKKLANRRNLTLYASPNGIPHAMGVKEFLIYRKSVVVSHIMAFLLIDQNEEHQMFVSHAMNIFLSIVEKFPRDDA